MMLDDARVMINEPDKDGYTPHSAASREQLELIKWTMKSVEGSWILERKEQHRMSLERRKKKKTEIVSLLERFKNDPAATRFDVQLGLGIHRPRRPIFLLQWSCFATATLP